MATSWTNARAEPARAPHASAHESDQPASHGAVRIWLGLVAVLVFCMVIVGGATRLTDSGLSITEWQPILGAIPPLSDADWQVAFDKYKLIPEYSEVNKGMSLAAFKTIFWWEWAHRFLGRIIGLAFGLPLLAFWLMGRVPRGYGAPLLGVLALGGVQGFFGWYMVQSGLSERVDVSHYRLALHLVTALVILAALVWIWLSLAPRDQAIRLATLGRSHRRGGQALFLLVFLQMVLGAFVAGLKAGLTYTTWPLMDGKLVPDGLFSLQPWYLNTVENITMVQFNHRLLAYVILAVALWHGWRVLRDADHPSVSRSVVVVVLALMAQAGLGIWTLLSVDDGAIPILQGLAHQGGAAVVVIVVTWHLHALLGATRQQP